MRSVGLYPIRCILSLMMVFFTSGCERVLAVGGISSSKVVVPSAETVAKGQVEIEPFFRLTIVDDPDDTVQFESGGRFTVGIFDDLEVGANVGYLTIEESDIADRESEFGDVEAGLKYGFLDEGEGSSFSLAYEGGITFPISGGDSPWVFELIGLILTKGFSDEFSIDADIVLALIEDDSVGLVSEVGFGCFITPRFQPVVEAGYLFENPGDGDRIHVFNITLGFTSLVLETLAVTIGVTKDLYTRNTDDTTVFSAALTFLF